MKDWYITPDIEKVQALDDYKLYIKFENGQEKIFDMKYLINSSKMYFRLTDKEYFKRVKTRKDTVEWENGEDIAPEILYHESISKNET